MSKARRIARPMVLACVAAVTLAACGQGEAVYPDRRPGDDQATYSNQPRETVFGPGGLKDLFGETKKRAAESGVGVGVNGYLWRASLDTVGFMPLASADPFGGVIITDWYSPPETANERFKLNVFILDRTLRADGVKVTVFRQVRDAAGNWLDRPVEAKTVTEVENAILTRARQLRTVSVQK